MIRAYCDKCQLYSYTNLKCNQCDQLIDSPGPDRTSPEITRLLRKYSAGLQDCKLHLRLSQTSEERREAEILIGLFDTIVIDLRNLTHS